MVTAELVSTAVLLPGTGSTTPAGAATVAVLVSAPVVPPATTPDTVNVATAPDARSSPAVIALPDPEAAPQLPTPLDTTHVHDTPVTAAGIESVRLAPVTADGPLFVTCTVYVTGPPATYGFGDDTFDTARSAATVVTAELVSTAVLLPGTGSTTPAGAATVAVLVSAPVVPAATTPDTVNVATAPDARSSPAVIALPDPEAAPQLPTPLDTRHVHDTPVTAAGIESVRLAPVTADDPLFVTCTVYVTGPPATYGFGDDTFDTARSANGVSVSVSVALLLPAHRVDHPCRHRGTVAVFESVPVAAGDTVPLTTTVATAPAARSSVAETALPLPDGAAQAPPPVTAHVHDTPVIAAGTVSARTAPVTAVGPPFVTCTVYVTGWPGAVAATPSVFVTARSACGASVSVSVALLLPATGSVQPAGTEALAVFESDPVAAGDSVPATVIVAVAPGARSSPVETALPEPEATAQPPVPAVTEHVHDTPVTAAGTVSARTAPTTPDGPLFVTVTVYVTGPPGTSAPTPSVFDTARSACGATTSVSVALSLPATGSVQPAGTEALAVFESVPVAAGGHRHPPATEHVHDAPVSAAGTSRRPRRPRPRTGRCFLTVTV